MIVPGEIAGVQLSHLLIHPRVSDFIASAIGDGDFEFAELDVSHFPHFVGKSLRELNLTNAARVIVIAVVDERRKFEFSPPADRALSADQTLIVVGPEGAQQRLDAIDRTQQ